MTRLVRVFNPSSAQDPQGAALGRTLDDLRGKVVGFIDNAKPNFQHLVDDLEARLVSQFGVKSVRKHRKPGHMPVEPDALERLVAQCDAVITGSGD